jgi:glycosyltransferase involved in cell wall biosynthesis
MKLTILSLRAAPLFLPGVDIVHGGSETGIAILCRELACRGEDVHLICCHPDPPGDTCLDGIKLHFVKPPKKPSPAASLAFYKSIYSIIKKTDPDLLYQAGLGKLTVAARWMAYRQRIPFVFRAANDVDLIPDGHLKWGPLVARAFAWALRSSTTLISQTPVQQELLRLHFQLDSSLVPNCKVVHDVPKMERSGALWIGRITAAKRAELFLDLARNHPAHTFTLAGPVTGDAYGREMLERAARQPNLRVTGGLPPQRIVEELARADMLVCTSVHEGFPNTFLEACLCSTPILSLGIDPDSLLAEHGAGVLVQTIEELDAAYERLHGDSGLRQRIGNAGRAALEARYRSDVVAGMYLEIFKRSVEAFHR